MNLLINMQERSIIVNMIINTARHTIDNIGVVLLQKAINTACGVALPKNAFENLLEEILWIMHPLGSTAVAF